MAFDGGGALSGATSGASAGSVFGPWGAGIGGALGGIAGGLFGGNSAKKKAEQARKAALADIANTNAEMGDSAFGGVNADPSLVAAQRSVLQRMMQEGNRQGLGLEDRVALNQAQNQIAQQERGAREAVLQNYAARGMGGSGAELAASLQNQQGAAGRAAGFGADAAASARQRQLAALAQSGTMAGQQREQGFGEQATKASATDAAARFNAAQRMAKANSLANIRTGQASAYDTQAGQDNGFASGLSTALGTLGGKYGQQGLTKLFGGG